VLPEHDLVIIDEAHELVDRVTSVATGELTSSAVAIAVRRCGKLIDGAVADRLQESSEGLAIILEDLPAGRLDTLPKPLEATLKTVRDAAHACLASLGSDRKEDLGEATARKLARSQVEEIHDTATRLLDAFDEDAAHQRDVVWLSADRFGAGNRPPMLHVAPLSVSGLLRERVFGATTTVLTSATLCLGGAFDTLARQWGLPPSPAQDTAANSGQATATEKAPPADDQELKWTGLDVGSPFDHRRNGILYVAKHLPPPGRDGLGKSTLDEIAELIDAAGGRTLGLFSSMRAAKQATEELRDRVEHPILCQGEDSTSLLVRKFADDPRTCLFGTLSLWQGVDVPGPSLQLVIVDRIPFPRPDDPVSSARQRAVEARGGNGFLTVAATHAALLLAQGTGRLHRAVADRGVVAVLDSRLATARYGGFLRASLPPFWPTSDPDVARAALRRLDASAEAPAGQGNH
jgi:ATP-dependent DNA helicase DinG